jgi:alpha-beta hydrolase superfamily lysophospholipase
MTGGRLLMGLLGLSLLLGCVAASLPEVDLRAAPPRRAWLPEGEPRAAILALHGFNDYSAAFAGFGSFAAERGVAVFAYDQRGFGANADAGLWPGTTRLIADLRRELAALKARYPDRPVYVLGESMGAAVTIAAAADEPPVVADGLILSAPAVWGGDQLNGFYRATLWLAAQIAPGFKLTGESLEIWPSDNIEMLRALSADPLVIKGTRIDAVAGLVGLMDRAIAVAGRVRGRLLVLTGEQDQIVPLPAFAELRAELQSPDCTTIDYPKGYHMLLRDLQRATVWADVLAWIDHAPPPSGLAGPCAEPVKADVASRS